MILAENNKIVSEFIRQEVNKKDVFYKEVYMQDLDVLPDFTKDTMYYDDILINVHISRNYRFIKSVLKLESDCIKVILSADSIQDYYYCKGILQKSNVKFIELSLKTLDSIRVKNIIKNLYLLGYEKEFKDADINKIYKKLKYSTKVNEEFYIISNFRTLGSMREYLIVKDIIKPSNIAINILLGENKKEVYAYIANNMNNINYIMKILLNYVELSMKIYPYFYKGIINDENHTIPDDDSITDKQVRLLLKLYSRVSYKYLYSLDNILEDAKTKSDKLVILMEMIL